MKRLIVAIVALAAGAAYAQPPEARPKPRPVAHAYAGPDGLTVEVETLPGRKGPFPHTLRLGEEPASVLTFTGEIGTADKEFLGNARAGLVPGARQPVAVFQVMPREGYDYSPAMTGACGGHAGIPFIGIESASGSIRANGFDTKAAARVYIFEETFAPGRVNLRLCGTIDLKAD